MRGFCSPISQPFGGEENDPTQVTRSYDGVVASSRRRVLGAITAKLMAIPQPFVYGGLNAASDYIRSSLHPVGKVAGQSSEVMFVPDTDMSPRNAQTPSADASDARTSFGMLGPLKWDVVERIAASADRELYECPITVSQVSV